MITIYSKPNCQYCVRAKNLLLSRGEQYNEVIIGEGISRDQFISMFPDVKTVPLIFIDGVRIGGFNELTEHFGDGRQLLTEG